MAAARDEEFAELSMRRQRAGQAVQASILCDTLLAIGPSVRSMDEACWSDESPHRKSPYGEIEGEGKRTETETGYEARVEAIFGCFVGA